MQKIILIDVDDVTLPLGPQWLAAYNRDWNDNIQFEDISDWNWMNFIKPECGRDIYKYLEDGQLYENIQPIPGAAAGVIQFREWGFRPVFVTSMSPEYGNVGSLAPKYDALVRLGFIESADDYVACRDKTLVRGEILIDDRYDNYLASPYRSILKTQPWNKKYKVERRADTWIEIIELANEMIPRWL